VSASEVVAAVVLVVPMDIGLLWVRGLTLIALARWFLVPLFPALPLPSAFGAAGLACLVHAFRPNGRRAKDDDVRGPMGHLLHEAAVSLAGSGLFWTLGALLYWLGSLP
jgi:hypothetical protein